MFNNGIPEDIDILDLLNVFSLWAQLDNMQTDGVHNKYIHKVIKAIANEIELLHKENDIIMKQNEEIINMLKRKEIK